MAIQLDLSDDKETLAIDALTKLDLIELRDLIRRLKQKEMEMSGKVDGEKLDKLNSS